MPVFSQQLILFSFLMIGKVCVYLLQEGYVSDSVKTFVYVRVKHILVFPHNGIVNSFYGVVARPTEAEPLVVSFELGLPLRFQS